MKVFQSWPSTATVWNRRTLSGIPHSSWTKCYIYKFRTKSALYLLFHAELGLVQGQMWAERVRLISAFRDFLRGNWARFCKLICFAVSRGFANSSLNPGNSLTKEADVLKTARVLSKPTSCPGLQIVAPSWVVDTRHCVVVTLVWRNLVIIFLSIARFMVVDV